MRDIFIAILVPLKFTDDNKTVLFCYVITQIGLLRAIF